MILYAVKRKFVVPVKMFENSVFYVIRILVIDLHSITLEVVSYLVWK